MDIPTGHEAGLAYHWFRFAPSPDTLPPEGHADPGPPLLLLPGLMDDATTLRRLARALSARHRVLLVEPLGAGASLVPDDLAEYRWPAQVERLRHLLEALGLHQVDAVGLSLGGMWLQHALAAGLEVRRVVLCATAADVDPRLSCIIESLQAQHEAGLPPEVLCRSLLPLLFSPRFLARPAAVPTLLSLMLGRPFGGSGLRGQLSALRGHGLDERLPAAAQRRRVHLIHGEHDFLIPAPAQQRLAGLLSGAAGPPQVMSGLGHCLWFEDAERFAAAILGALAAVDAAPEPGPQNDLPGLA